MHWKLKAAAQRLVSSLPPSASYAAYFLFQKYLGSLKKVDPTDGLLTGIMAWERIKRCGAEPNAKKFFEVGTGRMPLVPLAFWLMGAGETITIDVNPYLKSPLVKECLEHISKDQDRIRKLFGHFLDQKRYGALVKFCRERPFKLMSFLDLCCVKYVAPGDAVCTSLDCACIDFHTSFRVFEHVPEENLRKILEEGERIAKRNALFVHRIDYTDHFSHSDGRISRINFLQFSDKSWEKYSGNRYMYMNRLRHDDYIGLFQEAGHEILLNEPDLDEGLLQTIRNGGFPLSEKYRTKPAEVIATTGAWIISRPKRKVSKECKFGGLSLRPD